jgi:hypothetical protein
MKIAPLIFLIVLPVVLFTVGIIMLFYTKKYIAWNINLMEKLHKRKLVLFYKYRIAMLKNGSTILGTKISGAVSILIGVLVFIFVLRIFSGL